MIIKQNSKPKISSFQEAELTHFEPQFQDLSERVKINFNNYFILNRSAIQIFSCQNNPQIFLTLKNKIDCNLIQKLNLSKCNIINFNQFWPQLENNSINNYKQFSSQRNSLQNSNKKFQNLKQLILQANYIQKIPQSIAKLQNLLILKLSRNQIKYIPYLGNISYFSIKQNPIKEISTQIKNSRISCFQIDWADFIIQKTNNWFLENTFNSNANYFMQIINNIELKCQQKFITFQDMFQAKIKNKSEQYVKRIISIYFNKALNINFTPFFQFLKSLNNFNFNQLKFNGKFLLQKVLQINQQNLISLFMQKKSYLNSNELYFENICLACKYSNLTFFKYLMSMKTKKMILAQHQQFIRMQALYSFDKNLGSNQILQQIIQNSTKKCAQIFIIPNEFTKKQSQCIGQALIFIIQNERLFCKFDFTLERNYQNDVLYMQFAIHIKNILLLKLLLFKLKLNPFLYNYYLKTARSAKGTILGRKILFKVQKKLIQNHFTLPKISTNNQLKFQKQIIENQIKNSKIQTQIIIQKSLPSYHMINLFKESMYQQIELKKLRTYYLTLLQQKMFKEKDPIHLKRSSFRLDFQIQKKQFIQKRRKIKKEMIQKLTILQQQNQIISMESSKKSKINSTLSTKCKNQLLQYQLFQNVLFMNTDFTKQESQIKQTKVNFVKNVNNFCNNEGYIQKNQLQYHGITKMNVQQEKTCGNFICFQVNQVHKDQYVYYT